MHLTTTFVAVAGIITLAAAHPAASPAATPSASQVTSVSPDQVKAALSGNKPATSTFSVNSVPTDGDTGVFLCTESNFAGSCWHIIQPNATCLAAGPEMDNQISSVGPDDGFSCTFYNDATCGDADGSFITAYPGVPDLNDYNGGFEFNDQISSWQCVAA